MIAGAVPARTHARMPTPNLRDLLVTSSGTGSSRHVQTWQPSAANWCRSAEAAAAGELSQEEQTAARQRVIDRMMRREP